MYRYFVSQSSELCCHNSSCCFSVSVCCKHIFRYRLSPETFGYTLVIKILKFRDAFDIKVGSDILCDWKRLYFKWVVK
jgi:hypothetical protein